VEDDGVLGELVEMGDRLDKDRRRGGYAGELASANGLKDGEKGIRILADRQKLRAVIRQGRHVYSGELTYLWLLSNDAGRIACLQCAKSL
jgi:hypothetical protein